MTSYGAYNAGLPCKNTSCRSHGKPHPNCRCYGEMADGGQVEPYCSKSQAHKPGCEYFAEGGDVGGTNEEPPSPIETAEGGSSEGTNEEPPDTIDGGGGTDEEPPGAESGFLDKALTAYQGGLKGLTGPLADMVIKENPLIFGSPDTAKEREEENPGIAGVSQAATFIGSAIMGTGIAGAAAKASELATGSKVLQSAIQGGLLQTADEAGKWAMGEGNPEDAAGAVTSIGAATLFGGLLGAASQGASKGASLGLKKLAETKMGQSATSFLRGLGFAAKSQDAALREIDASIVERGEDVIPKAYKAGVKFFDKYLIPSSTATAGAVYGWHEDGPLGAIAGAASGAAIGIAGRKVMTAAGRKVIAPAVFKILSSGNVQGMANALDHAENLAKGAKLVNGAVDAVFKMSPAISSMAVSAYGSDRLKKDLDTFLGNGGVTQSIQEEIYDQNGGPEVGYAEGGEVKKPKDKSPKQKPNSLLSVDDGVAMHYPEQNMLLSAARGRVSNYLMGLRPTSNSPKLPFDDEPDTRQKKKAYDRALNIAISPLSIMHEIKKGTIESEHIKHLNGMYPELTGLLQKKATEQITKAQLAGKKPPLKVRQGLSMLLGTALSSEMTPQSIQAAQSVFQKGSAENAPAQPAQGGGSSKTKLSKSDQSFLTGSQARQKRGQRET